MGEITSHEPGTPSWVDLGTPDVAAATEFYGGLFEWDVEDQGPDAGGYAMCRLNGKNVAGLGPLQNEGQPPAWTTYVTVDDADATVEKVKEHGGQVLMEPDDVFDAGRMAVLMDPAGAAFSLWQPNEHIGAELVNEPGTLCWNELTTREVDGAKEFYGEVFGWGGDTNEFDSSTYTEWKAGDRTIGGMMEMNDEWPADVPPHWMAYFAVEDCEASAKKAEELGGKISVPPTDTPAGRFAVLNDPHGAVFSVIKLAEGSSGGDDSQDSDDSDEDKSSDEAKGPDDEG